MLRAEMLRDGKWCALGEARLLLQTPDSWLPRFERARVLQGLYGGWIAPPWRVVHIGCGRVVVSSEEADADDPLARIEQERAHYERRVASGWGLRDDSSQLDYADGQGCVS